MAVRKQAPQPKQQTTKVYTYTRVSTTIQIDGYSLDAQRSRLKAYADFNGYEIVRGYEDAGKSGKSIEGRTEYNRMLREDLSRGFSPINDLIALANNHIIRETIK